LSPTDDRVMIFHQQVEAEYPDFLKDESRRVGQCEILVFPENETEIREALIFAKEKDLSVTIQGARTGITAGAVPDTGLLLNLSRMNKMVGMRYDPDTDRFQLRVQPGVTLADINTHISHKDFEADSWSDDALEAFALFKGRGAFFFSPDPTEQTAAIGGMVSCNASGARSFKYGATRPHIHRIRIMTVDGDIVILTRGGAKANGRSFALTTEQGKIIEGTLPGYDALSIKSAAGYWVHDGMEMIDLFIGAEGTLGIITEIDILLLPAPAVIWGVTAFFPSEEQAIDFVSHVRKEDDTLPLKPVAIEFFDHNALALLRRQREKNTAFSALPDIPDGYHTGIYVEYDGDNEDQVAEAVEAMCDVLNRSGGNEDATWIATDHHELQRLKDFRHAIPESVNMLIDERRHDDPTLTKLGTDMAVSDEHLATIMHVYHDALTEAGLEYVIFGHVGNNHVHVNILPRNAADYTNGKKLYMAWAEKIVAMGGTVSAEHGIGKLKVPFLQIMYGEEGLGEMKALKRSFDPAGRLNPGNLFVL